jgi:hypothetical protein
LLLSIDNEKPVITFSQFDEIINLKMMTIYEQDLDGRTALDIALERYNTQNELEKDEDLQRVVLYLLKLFLPVDVISGEPRDVQLHNYSWISVLCSDENLAVVEKLMKDCQPFASVLVESPDDLGRKAINVATESHRLQLLRSTYFFHRYEILTKGSPVHETATCVVHLATDHDHCNNKVALKFMRNKDQYLQEKRVREEASRDPRFIIEIADTHDRCLFRLAYLTRLNNFSFYFVLP